MVLMLLMNLITLLEMMDEMMTLKTLRLKMMVFWEAPVMSRMGPVTLMLMRKVSKTSLLVTMIVPLLAMMTWVTEMV